MDDRYSFHHSCGKRKKNTIVNCLDVPRLHDINTETDHANGEQNISRSPVLETETEKVFVSRIFI